MEAGLITFIINIPYVFNVHVCHLVCLVYILWLPDNHGIYFSALGAMPHLVLKVTGF